MATLLQRKAVEKLVENGRSVSKAMRDAGYSPETAKVPGKLTESKGFKEICQEHGLTDSLILDALVSDIKAKPKRRVGELGLGARILNLDKQTNTTNNIVLILDD